MATKIKSATISGIGSLIIKVEVNISPGLPSFHIVGLPNKEISEARERVRTAIINSGYEYPLGRIVVNLAPADRTKEGSLLDLPIALGILMESNQIYSTNLDEFITFGELSLDGTLTAISGSLPIILDGLENKIKKFIVPNDNTEELDALRKGEIYNFQNLREVCSFINNRDMLPYEFSKVIKNKNLEGININNIIGQNISKRALEIAAAGRHHIMFFGTPGSGKTMLANSLRRLLPDLKEEEFLEVAKVYSALGKIKELEKLRIPFRAPASTITKTALIGGGRKIKPGEITLAHNGVLFLDEILEFKRDVLELLRIPIEDGKIEITRLNNSVIMPSKFMLVGTFNTCPCGKNILGSYENNGCRCSEREILNYQNRMSNALKDRIDIFNYVPKVEYGDIYKKNKSDEEKKIKKNIIKARKIQENRFKESKYRYNSDVNGKDIFKIFKINEDGKNFLEKFLKDTGISIRGYGKIIKIAQTIADIEGESEIKAEFLMEAMNYRKDINGKFI